MLNEKIDIEIGGRKLRVEMDGFSELEVNSLAQLVSQRMQEVEKTSKIPDTSKIAILTAMEFAADLWKLKSKHENDRVVDANKMEAMIITLQNALETR